MILAIDVDYRENAKASVAGILFENWQDKEPKEIITTVVEDVSEYQSGQFYKRELPCILALLDKIDIELSYIVVDGYVFLGESKKGLGAYLYDALDTKIPIIGVAKSPFRDISSDSFIYRGESKKPLFITSIGIELDKAKEAIGNMYGKFRIPFLLKEADRVCRLNME